MMNEENACMKAKMPPQQITGSVRADSSSCVEESRVIKAPIAKVWASVRGLQNLNKFWPAVQASVLDSGAASDQVGSVQKVTFKDATVQKFKVCILFIHSYSIHIYIYI